MFPVDTFSIVAIYLPVKERTKLHLLCKDVRKIMTTYHLPMYEKVKYSVRIPNYELKNILHLNCSKMNLKTIPEMPSLKTLDCSFNQIQFLPKLDNVVILYCDFNQLEEITSLKNCQYVSCAKNPIKKLDLPNLKNVVSDENLTKILPPRSLVKIF